MVRSCEELDQHPVLLSNIAESINPLLAESTVAGVPSIVRHHFLILAVPVDDVRAEALIVKSPEKFEPLRVDQETAGVKSVAEITSELGKMAMQLTTSEQTNSHHLIVLFTLKTISVLG